MAQVPERCAGVRTGVGRVSVEGTVVIKAPDAPITHPIKVGVGGDEVTDGRSVGGTGLGLSLSRHGNLSLLIRVS